MHRCRHTFFLHLLFILVDQNLCTCIIYISVHSYRIILIMNDKLSPNAASIVRPKSFTFHWSIYEMWYRIVRKLRENKFKQREIKKNYTTVIQSAIWPSYWCWLKKKQKVSTLMRAFNLCFILWVCMSLSI